MVNVEELMGNKQTTKRQPTKVIASKLPCDACGSSDARHEYDFKDPELRNERSRTWFCFACNANGKVVPDEVTAKEPDEVTAKEPDEVTVRGTNGGNAWVPVRESWRMIKHEVFNRYGVTTKEDGTEFAFPYNGRAKIRGRDVKDFVVVKGHPSSVSVKQDGDLFGQSLFSPGGKVVTITEGELDALSLYQVFGKDYPVVSLPSGAGGAVRACKEAFEWINSFTSVVLAFDADEPGQEAVAEVALLFPGKVKVMKMDPVLKDANGYLTAGKREQLFDAFWKASPYRPSDVVNAADLLDDLLTPAVEPLFNWPYPELQSMTDGVRPGEIVIFTAGTGIGKSSALRELLDEILKQGDFKIGMMMLEESRSVTVKRQASIRLRKRIYRTGVKVDEELLRSTHQELFGSGRIELFSQLKVTTPDEMLSRIEYMIRGLGCQLILLDHLSFIISGAETDNERKEIDVFMTKLRSLTESTGAAILMVSHLSKQSGSESHEEGGRVLMSQLRGSGGIAQLSDMVIALERDPQNTVKRDRKGEVIEPEIPPGYTRWRLLKNRWIGDTGPAFFTFYNKETGMSTYVGAEVGQTNSITL